MSTADPVTEKFQDLDYPGRRRPVNRDGKKRTIPKQQVWDGHPVFYMVNGNRQEFFTIGHLAKALGYSQQSIRAWEATGLLPKSGIRSPKARKPMAGGRSTKGKRLWTREQIDGILRIAQAEGVILNRKPPTLAFAKKVRDMFRELQSL
jgi:hypothetical protein